MFNLFNFCITNLKQNLKRAGNPASDNGCITMTRRSLLLFGIFPVSHFCRTKIPAGLR